MTNEQLKAILKESLETQERIRRNLDLMLISMRGTKEDLDMDIKTTKRKMGEI